ncbi:hypothetical protein N8865_02590 [Francisellaceae bacterium]|nr:hypothetical protein [Francisellaceae bacterium]
MKKLLLSALLANTLVASSFAGAGFEVKIINETDHALTLSTNGWDGEHCWYTNDLKKGEVVNPHDERKFYTEAKNSGSCRYAGVAGGTYWFKRFSLTGHANGASYTNNFSIDINGKGHMQVNPILFNLEERTNDEEVMDEHYCGARIENNFVNNGSADIEIRVSAPTENSLARFTGKLTHVDCD